MHKFQCKIEVNSRQIEGYPLRNYPFSKDNIIHINRKVCIHRYRKYNKKVNINYIAEEPDNQVFQKKNFLCVKTRVNL
jgi:hypothetical protein